jgi:DNA-binding FadR family transcriptional regulator
LEVPIRYTHNGLPAAREACERNSAPEEAMSILADSAVKPVHSRARAEPGRAGVDSSRDPLSVAQLFSCVVGDAEAMLKCAGRTARSLEEQFILDGWPVGRIYGCETDLAHRYGVGRAVVRETARILEARGTARMCRGRHGGLELTAPAAGTLHDMIGGYCFLLGVTSGHLRRARTVLDRVAAYMATERGAHFEFLPLLDHEALDVPAPGWNLRRLLNAAAGNSVVTCYSDCLDELRRLPLPQDGAFAQAPPRRGTLSQCIDRLVIAISRGEARTAAAWAGACSQRIEAESGQPAAMSHPGAHARQSLDRTRAGQIVRQLMKHVGPGNWRDGYVLGNEFELCERFRVDRGVLRQAIRILEAAETAASLPGRGHGLVARTPGPASASRLLCCHFAASRVSHHEAFAAFKWLGVEMVTLAAEQDKSTSCLAPSRAVLGALSKRTDTVLLSELIDIEERQFALARNPVLDLFLRSAKAFPSWIMHGNLPVSGQVLHDFLECSTEVNEAIAANDPVAAGKAQEHKFVRLRHNLDHFFANFRSGSLMLSAPSDK